MLHAFFLEAGFWGLPCEAFVGAFREISQGILDIFERERLAATRVRTWISSRRVAFLIEGIPDSQPDSTVEIRGPKASTAYDFNGLPTPALQGFASAQGVESKDLLIKKDSDGEKYLFARRSSKGKNALDVIVNLLPELISSLPWRIPPWQTGKLFPQPPAYLCALWDNSIFSCTLDGITAGREVGLFEGGNFRMIAVPSALEYPGIAAGLGLSMLPSDRQKLIESYFQSIVPSGGAVKKDRRTIEKIAFEIERPQPILVSLEDDFRELPEILYIQILSESPSYLPIESSRGVMTNNILGFIEKRNVSPNEIAMRAREVSQRLKLAAKLWQADKSKPLEELAAVLRFLAAPWGTGTLYDLALIVSHKAQFLKTFPALALDVQETSIDRIILSAVSEYSFLTIRRYPALIGHLLPLVAYEQGLSPETVSLLKETAAYWAGHGNIPESPIAVLCSLAGLLTKLQFETSNTTREQTADRIVDLLEAKNIYIDIIQAFGNNELQLPQNFWHEALARRMQREGLDLKKFSWLVPTEGRFDIIAILNAAHTWKDGPPPECDQLRSLTRRIQVKLANFSVSSIPYQPETPPEKGLAAILEKLEKFDCLSYTEVYNQLLAGRIYSEACLMDIPEGKVETSDISRRISLLRRYHEQLVRLPFLEISTKSKP